MRFKKGVKGYFKLGIVFTIFLSVIGMLFAFVAMPMLFGGLLLGGVEGILITIPIIIIVAILLQGWVVHWFFRKNKFK